MKRHLRNSSKVVALILIVSMLLVGCSPKSDPVVKSEPEKTENVAKDTEKKEKIVLTYSDHDPTGGMRTGFIKDVWLPEIVKQTNGQVEFHEFWGGSLLESGDALGGIGSGVADIGMVFPDFYTSQLFTFQIFRLFPESPEKYEDIVKIVNTAMAEVPQFSTELEKNNIKPLFVTVGLPSASAATYPIDGTKDMIGKKWRASSKWHLETFKYHDINPVSVPWGDVYMALQTNTIDGVFTNFDGLAMMRFHEVAPNLIVSPQLWWASPFLHSINVDKWNSLPEDIQEGILKATEIAEQKFGEYYAGKIETTINTLKAEGANIKIATEEDISYFTDSDLLDQLRAAWVKEARDNLKMETPEKVMEQVELIFEEAFKNQ